MGVVGDATTRGLLTTMMAAVEARGAGGGNACEYARSKVACPLQHAYTRARTRRIRPRKEEMSLVTCLPLFPLFCRFADGGYEPDNLAAAATSRKARGVEAPICEKNNDNITISIIIIIIIIISTVMVDSWHKNAAFPMHQVPLLVTRCWKSIRCGGSTSSTTRSPRALATTRGTDSSPSFLGNSKADVF